MFINIKNPPVKHEMMHMVVMMKWGFPHETSKWINEGLAAYSENSCNGFNVEQIYCFFQKNNMLIPIESLANNFYANPEMKAYHQVAFLAEYLQKNYGILLLKELWVRGMDDFENIYKKPVNEILAEIKDYLALKYPETPSINWDEFKKGCY